MANIVAFGELLWDLLPDGKVLGGAPANFIFRVNSYGDKGALITRLGEDKLGREARKYVDSIGLSLEHVQTDQVFPTGTVEVKLDKNGIPDFTIIKDVAYDHIEITSEMIDDVSQSDCLYFGTLIQRYGISKNTLKELIKVAGSSIKFMDINLRKSCYTKQTIEDSFHATNILKINDDELLAVKYLLNISANELKIIAGTLISEFDIDIVLVTLGANGAFVLNKQNEYFYDAGYKVQLVDTVGSGDAFSAAFIHSFLKDKDISKALILGNACGALAATTKGATAPFTKNDVLNFMEQKLTRNEL